MRIGIVGSDNTHALGFAKIVNVTHRAGPSVQVVAISGADEDATRHVAAEGRIPEVTSGPEDMVDRVDAAIIVDRDGGLHKSHAAPFLSAGLPVLVDKPLATNVTDAAAILQLAREHGALVTSYSSLRWCSDTQQLARAAPDVGPVVLVEVAGLCDFASPYGGHFFYGIHEIEVALALHPCRPNSVRVDPSGPVRTATVRAEDGCVLALSLIGPSDGVIPEIPFHAACYGPRGRIGRTIKNEPDLTAALDKFLVMVASGVPALTEEQMVTPIAILEGIGESARNDGRHIDISPLL